MTNCGAFAKGDSANMSNHFGAGKSFSILKLMHEIKSLYSKFYQVYAAKDGVQLWVKLHMAKDNFLGKAQ